MSRGPRKTLNKMVLWTAATSALVRPEPLPPTVSWFSSVKNREGRYQSRGEAIPSAGARKLGTSHASPGGLPAVELPKERGRSSRYLGGVQTGWKQGGCCPREVGRDSGGGEVKRGEDSGGSEKKRGEPAPCSVARFLLVYTLLSATGRKASVLR